MICLPIHTTVDEKSPKCNVLKCTKSLSLSLQTFFSGVHQVWGPVHTNLNTASFMQFHQHTNRISSAWGKLLPAQRLWTQSQKKRAFQQQNLTFGYDCWSQSSLYLSCIYTQRQSVNAMVSAWHQCQEKISKTAALDDVTAMFDAPRG